MAPTYNDGDWLLFWSLNPSASRRVARLTGKVVVLERESYPGVLFIKRVIRIDGDEIWVEGDNKSASTDSRQWGALSSSEIIGRILFRYKRSN